MGRDGAKGARRGRWTGLMSLVVVTMLTACSGTPTTEGPNSSAGASSATPSPSPEPTPTPVARGPVIREVPEEQWAAMVATGMVREGCPITERSELRRVDLDYLDFEGETQRGHLVVHADTAASVARIFTRLYAMEFPIRKMQGAENYGGDVAKSLADHNTSAYNCRRPDQINAPVHASPHANGRAVDINPVENPWMDLRCHCWTPSGKHAERTPGPGKILKYGDVWDVFDAEGWIWENISVPDYMHFDTGYPSKPFGT